VRGQRSNAGITWSQPRYAHWTSGSRPTAHGGPYSKMPSATTSTPCRMSSEKESVTSLMMQAGYTALSGLLHELATPQLDTSATLSTTLRDSYGTVGSPFPQCPYPQFRDTSAPWGMPDRPMCRRALAAATSNVSRSSLRSMLDRDWRKTGVLPAEIWPRLRQVASSNVMFTFAVHPDTMNLSRTVSRVAAITAAALALVAAVSAAAAVPFASTEVLVSELWRTVGLGTWVALFALLAVSPRLLPVWVIALSSKIALVISGLAIGSGTPGARDLVLWDGILSLILAAGLISCIRMRAFDRDSQHLPEPG
jgi:hypothetical protein